MVGLERSGVLIAGVGAVACRAAGADAFSFATGWGLAELGAVGNGLGLGLLCTAVTAGVALPKVVEGSAGAEAWISSIRLNRRAPGSGGFHFVLEAVCSASVVACLNSGVSSGKLKAGIACPLEKVRLERELLAGWIA